MGQRVLVVLDFCWTERFASEAALVLAGHLHSHGADMFVTAFAGFDEDVVRESKARKVRGHTVYHDADLPNVLDTLRDDYRTMADTFAENCRREGIPCTTELVSVEPMAALLRSAEVSDWVTVPRDAQFSHSEGLTSDTSGPAQRVVSQLCREAAVPVLVGPTVPQQQRPLPPRKLLVAYDGSDGASRIVHSIGALGLAEGFEAEVLTVASGEREASELAEQAASVLRTHGATAMASPIATSEHPAGVILERVAAIQPAFLAMGAFGHRTWQERIFGSVTERLLKDCPCALFVQR